MWMGNMGVTYSSGKGQLYRIGHYSTGGFSSFLALSLTYETNVMQLQPMS